MKLIGFILILLGILMIFSREFNFTAKKKVIDTGTIEINKMENKTVTWPWYAGGTAVVMGIVFLLLDKKKK